MGYNMRRCTIGFELMICKRRKGENVALRKPLVRRTWNWHICSIMILNKYGICHHYSRYSLIYESLNTCQWYWLRRRCLLTPRPYFLLWLWVVLRGTPAVSAVMTPVVANFTPPRRHSLKTVTVVNSYCWTVNKLLLQQQSLLPLAGCLKKLKQDCWVC